MAVNDPWGSFNTTSTPGGGGGYVDSGTWDNPSKGIDWGAAARTAGAGSEKTDTSQNPGTLPSLAPPQIQTPQSPVGRGQPRDIRELLTLLAQRQAMYQQAAHGPAAAGGPPQMPPKPLGLLGI